MEEALTLYVDGELPFAEQPALFAHLAACDACRRTLEGVMMFRRIIREESLALPPIADDAFLQRLAQHRTVTSTVSRAPDRRSILGERMPVSVRTAVTVALVVFFLGLFVPLGASSPEEVPLPWVQGVEERVEFDQEYVGPVIPAPVYVFYPGLTVEASKAEETGVAGSL